MSTFEGSADGLSPIAPELPVNSTRFVRMATELPFFLNSLPRELRTVPYLKVVPNDKQVQTNLSSMRNMMMRFHTKGPGAIEQLLYERYSGSIGRISDGGKKQLTSLSELEKQIWKARLSSLSLTRKDGVDIVAALLREVQVPNISRGPLQFWKFTLQEGKAKLPEMLLGRLTPQEQQTLGLSPVKK